MSEETRRPSATQPIDREALFDELEARGEVVTCPACGVGRVPPKLAQRVVAALHVDRDRETLPEPVAVAVVAPDEDS